MSSDELRIVETGDGSHTLYDPERDVHFRSTHGAVEESRHVFVEGTHPLDRASPVTILELGFGAGVNFVQTLRHLREQHPGARMTYHAVERAPVAPEHLAFHEGPAGNLARRALASAREPHSPVRVSGPDGRIELVLHLREWTTFDADLSADAVYYDPFGPKAEPESWTVECFEMAREQIADDALLGTYSAASDVKRAMAEAGFAVATAPGTGRKREVTFASPSPEALEPYELLDVD